MTDLSDKRVKIVCTLGPASSTPEVIGGLIDAGMNIVRLNFSHGEHSFHKKMIQIVREESKKRNVHIAIMQDLQGPKLRVGALPKEGIHFKKGDVVTLYPEGSTPKSSPSGSGLTCPLSAEIAESIAKDVMPGSRILFDDGKLLAMVKSVTVPEILIEFVVGGKLTSHKGINLPGTPLTLPCVTEKDFEDLKFGLDNGVDAIALSFVRSPKDIEQVREMIKKHTSARPLVISKIEREEAIDDMDAIIDVSDGLLVARGDMAVELGAERVPIVQKRLIHSCRELGVPIITATQMLESMITSPTPTRAEASDVANAVFDGTDAVMLSAETASGQYPLESVKIMSQIILRAEKEGRHYFTHPQVQPMPGSVVDSIEFSASRIAQHIGAKAVTCITRSGLAARTLAKYRPDTPIIALMEDEVSIRTLSFVWGVQGALLPEGFMTTDDVFMLVEDVLRKQGFVEQDDMIVITAGVPSLRKGTTNMVKVHRVGDAFEKAGQK